MSFREGARFVTGYALILAMFVGVMVAARPATSQTVPLEDRVLVLEQQVDYLSGFHPPSTTTTTTIPSQALVFDVDTVLTEPLVLRPGDTVELRDGARLQFGPGAYLDAQGTPTATWSWDGSDPATLTQNLVRDIRFFGSGGLDWMHGSGVSTIRFVEFDIQPLQIEGHYPLHWHHAQDGSRGTLVEGVVVKNSPNRCLVPHNSHGITFVDTICHSITETAVWWDPPPAGDLTLNVSHDIILDRVLVDGVQWASDKYRTFGFLLGSGSGNVIRDSLASGIYGGSHTGGYYWDGRDNGNPAGNVWTFQNNATVNSNKCAATWQNMPPVGGDTHHVNGLTCVNAAGISIGAYDMTQRWSNVVGAASTGLKSVNVTIDNAELGVVTLTSPPASGPVTISDSVIDGLTINDGGGATRGHQIVITNSGITCADVVVVSVGGTTSLAIDGVVCEVGV